jgi:hypothetical protein
MSVAAKEKKEEVPAIDIKRITEQFNAFMDRILTQGKTSSLNVSKLEDEALAARRAQGRTSFAQLKPATAEQSISELREFGVTKAAMTSAGSLAMIFDSVGNERELNFNSWMKEKIKILSLG